MNKKTTTSSSKTNWERLDQLKDEQIDTSDAPPLEDSFFDRAKIRLPKDKVSVLVAVEPDVLHWFQKQGGQYQQRISAALRIYAEAHGNTGLET